MVVAVAFLLSSHEYVYAQAADDLPAGWFQIPKTTGRFKIGGYIKLDALYDLKPIGSPDYFDVSKIPTDSSEGQTAHLNAKESRILMDFRSPSAVGELRGYVEGDFYGSGGAFRIRHAYAEVNEQLLAGQTWSTFMDENIIPPTLDYEKPSAYAFVRLPQVRFKQSFGKSAFLALAIEDPTTTAQAPPVTGAFEHPLPDFAARFRVTDSWGHIQLSGFASTLQYRDVTDVVDKVSLFGGNLSGQLHLFEKDKLSFQVIYGPGVAHYRGGLSAAVDSSGKLEALTAMSITASFEHYWSSAFSSVFVYNYGTDDNTAGQPVTAIHSLSYFAGNFLWHFAENAFMGLEYLHGMRENINTAEGTADRIQFSVQYSFNMK